MHQTRKGNQWFFGAKAHIGVESKEGIVHSVCTLAASESDVHMLPDLLHSAEKKVGAIATRISQENGAAKGNVLFAVMQMTNSKSPVYAALSALNKLTTLVSYGISDSPGGLKMYVPGSATGILLTGKPLLGRELPPTATKPLCVSVREIRGQRR
jgi:hypothetical protein